MTRTHTNKTVRNSKMNYIHVGNVQTTRGQTREAAAQELKVFLNEVLEEICPELGCVDYVSFPSVYSDKNDTCIGFITMEDRRPHLDVIETLDRVDYKCRHLLLTIGSRHQTLLTAMRCVSVGDDNKLLCVH